MNDTVNKHTKPEVPPLGGGGGDDGGGVGGGKSPFKKDGMFNDAHPAIFEMTKQLRKNMTHAEIVLWNYLKAGINGLRVRRQHPVGVYIADFYCHKIKLIIEIDGSIHDLKEIKDHDINRENDLREWGYTVIRFTNREVDKELDKVLDRITQVVTSIQSAMVSKTIVV